MGTYSDEDEDEIECDRIVAKLADLAATAMEHVDSVQIIATKHTNDGTRWFNAGRGDNFARYGACRKYVLDHEREEGDV